MNVIEKLERALQPSYVGWKDQYKAILNVLDIDPEMPWPESDDIPHKDECPTIYTYGCMIQVYTNKGWVNIHPGSPEPKKPILVDLVVNGESVFTEKTKHHAFEEGDRITINIENMGIPESTYRKYLNEDNDNSGDYFGLRKGRNG